MDQEYQKRMSSLMSEDESEKLQLFFSCRNLADLDFLTVTDSFLVIKLLEPNKPQKKILQTKVYDNDLNPDYAETITLQYFFQIRQKLVLEVFHQASPPRLVGRAETTVGQIFGSQTNGLKKPITNQTGKQTGQIIVKCEVVAKVTNNFLEMNILAFDLPSSFSFFCFGSSNSPFFRIYRVRQKDQLLIYESETVHDSENPKFKRIQLSQRRLCKNNSSFEFQIRFYNYSPTGAHSLIGKVITSVDKILDPKSFPLVDQRKRFKGNVRFQKVNRFVRYKFMDFMSAGLQLSLITCIDFTASNGSVKSSQSLHCIGPGKKSEYEEALGQVSNILLDYDSDKLVPVYGFGAKVNMPTFKSYNKTHHCFPLNGNESNANVFMVQGIINAYRNVLQYLELSGPTFFNQLLSQAIEECKSIQKQINQYMIVFILTDGEIHDKKQVIDQIVECCGLPISLIIVGVGNGPFDIMEELDDDDCQMVDSNGKRTYRDLVQFVQFKKFKNNGVQLAKQVLQQLPRQIEQYYMLTNRSPLQFPKVPQFQMPMGENQGWQQQPMNEMQPNKLIEGYSTQNIEMNNMNPYGNS